MNPFEIRLELLKLAHSIESEKNMNERIRVENDWRIRCDLADVKDSPPPPFPFIPTVSAEDVIKAAEALNAFVSNQPSASSAN